MLGSLLVLLLAAQTEPGVAPVAEKPKLICRETEQETGSHIRAGRRCKTADEWAQEDADRRGKPTTMRITAGQGDALTKERPQ